MICFRYYYCYQLLSYYYVLLLKLLLYGVGLSFRFSKPVVFRSSFAEEMAAPMAAPEDMPAMLGKPWLGSLTIGEIQCPCMQYIYCNHCNPTDLKGTARS